MLKVTPEAHNLCPEIKGWADRWMATDREYIEHRAQFAPEPTRSIAKLILALGSLTSKKQVNSKGGE